MERPAQFKLLGVANPVTGVISNVPMNTFKVRVRKGVEVASGQNPKVLQAELKISVPAGSDVEDPESIRAALSCLIGALWGDSSGIGDTLVDGIL
jgi:hypothetical protein